METYLRLMGSDTLDGFCGGCYKRRTFIISAHSLSSLGNVVVKVEGTTFLSRYEAYPIPG